MEFLNDAVANAMQLDKDSVEKILVSLSIMAPHMACELLERLLDKPLQACSWPEPDIVVLNDQDITIVVQVNGKLRANLVTKPGASLQELRPAAEEAIAKWLQEKKIEKVIFVTDRLINFVVN